MQPTFLDIRKYEENWSQTLWDPLMHQMQPVAIIITNEVPIILTKKNRKNCKLPRLVYVDWKIVEGTALPPPTDLSSSFLYCSLCSNTCICQAGNWKFIATEIEDQANIDGQYFDEIVYQNYWIGKWCGNMFICYERCNQLQSCCVYVETSLFIFQGFQ